MLKIHFAVKNGKTLPDGEVMDWCRGVCDNYLNFDLPNNIQHEVWVSQELMILAFRLLVKRGLFPKDKMRICWKNSLEQLIEVQPDERGRLTEHPPSIWDSFLCEVL